MVELLPLSYFQPLTIARSNAEFAERNEPPISILVTKLKNIVCIGLNFPHGFCDGQGMSIIGEAINQELDSPGKSKPCKPISLESGNLVEKNYEEVLLLEGKREGEEAYRDLCEVTSWNTAVFLLDWLKEQLWHRATTKMVYVGQDIIASIVAEAKKEAIAEGAFVSTNDIIMAWFLKVSQYNSHSIPMANLAS